jgi:hypothetical protein
MRSSWRPPRDHRRSLIVATDHLAVDSLQIRRINAADAPILDGDTSDRAWRDVKPFSLLTGEGGNFDGKGETRIEIRAVHDGTYAYFLFTWQDSTRSLKHLPLVKEADGWHLLHSGFQLGDEHQYNEDKFSVLLTTSDVTLAGGRPFIRDHSGRRRAGHHERSRTALHGNRLCRCLAVEGDEQRGRMDGRCPFRTAARIRPRCRRRTSFRTRAASRPTGNGKLPGQFHRRGRHVRRSAPQPPGRPLRLPKVVAATTDAWGISTSIPIMAKATARAGS